MKTIDNIKDANILIKNYRNLLGERTIICDVPLNSLKNIAKLLTNFKDNVLLLRTPEKDLKYISKIEYYLACIKGGTGFKGYKRASRYINTIEDCLKVIK